MELRERKLCTLEGVVFNSCAIHSSPRPSSTQRRILDACGFSATLLFPKAPFSSDRSSFIGHMYHFLLPDARYVTIFPRPRRRWTNQEHVHHHPARLQWIEGEPPLGPKKRRPGIGVAGCLL